MTRILVLFLLFFGVSFGFSQNNKAHGEKIVKVEKSTINWWGYKVVKSVATTHTGAIKMKMGKFIFKGKELVSGEFILDMRSITDTDLQGDDNLKLVNDLKSVNFFEVKKYPIAKFEMTKILPLKSNAYNSEIIGNITIKGIRKTISFPANVTKHEYSVSIESAKFSLNRKDYNIFYQSSLKDYLIKDQIDLQFQLSTK